MDALLERPSPRARASPSLRCQSSGVHVSQNYRDVKRADRPSFIAEGQQLRYCGVGAGFDDVVIDGNPDELKVRFVLHSYNLHH